MTSTAYRGRAHLDDPPGERPIGLIKIVVGYLIVLAVFIVLALVGVGIRDEYASMSRRVIAAESRATVAEAQLRQMLLHGDGGVVLARIDTRDLGAAEIVIRPRLAR